VNTLPDMGGSMVQYPEPLATPTPAGESAGDDSRGLHIGQITVNREMDLRTLVNLLERLV